MALSGLTAEGLRSQWMDGGTEEQPLEDEFACPGVLRGALGSLRPTVQQVFGVTLSIGGEDAFSQDGQMWLCLRGAGRDVQAAKVFVKGVVNQEAQQEFPFPEALYCVFCGAEGLFMDCLIKNTSAHLVVGSQSCLLITGLEEPVVKAYSFMTDLIEKYKSSQGQCSDPGSVITGESLDLLQRFKSLVEGREDRHTVSLLVLPVTVKKVLLDLVKQSGWDEKPGREDPSRAAPRTEGEVMPQKRPVDQNRTIVPPGVTHNKQSGLHGFNHHGANGTVRTSDVSNGFIPVSLCSTGSESLKETKRDDESGHRDEFQHLLKFFTVMGFTEEVVQRVLARTGPKEASQLLDLIQQEHDKSGLRRGNTETRRKDTDESAKEEQNAKPDDFVMVFTEDVVQRVLAHTGPKDDSQLVDLIQQEQDKSGQCRGNTETQRKDSGLLKFFTVMGFTEEVVQRVLARTGPKEASQLLDLIQQEQDKSGQRRGNTETRRIDTDESAKEEQNTKPDDFVMVLAEDVVQRVLARTDPKEDSQLLDLIQQEQDKSGQCRGNTETQRKDSGLLKFFTVMGFTEEVVQRVLARTGPKDASQLLDLIQQEQGKSGLRRGNTETRRKDTDESAKEEQNAKPDDFVMGVLKKAAATCGYTEEKVEQVYCSLTEPNPHQLLMELQRPDKRPGCDTTADPRTSVEENAMMWSADTLQPLVSVRGPPQTTYTSRPGLKNLNVRDVSPDQQPMNSHLRPAGLHTNHSFPKGPKISGVTQSKPRASQATAGASTGVTGRQRFIEGLKTPFRLQLSDDPGDDKLRQIIVDGSNVAMSHGLGLFFSCRGIALAVQHFWGRGHRKITVFVPQWRQKKDQKIKEQHYLTDLQDLGLLSFTPSREVEGRRINSYDDRFMLNLAQKTNGVIVTNDNLRDLVDESPAWRDIIKRSLLQYVFAGDLFMLPDDPMGRGGPHLNDFLQTHNRSVPPPGSHSFAGVSSSLSSPAPRAHTEVLRYRDRTPGGHGRGQGSVGGEQQGQVEDVRTAEDTFKLRQSLMQIFPEQESVVNMTLQHHPSIKDINQLTDFILQQQE